MADQFDLFSAPATLAAPAPAVTGVPVPRRGRKSRPQRPDLVAEVLTAIQHGQLGLLDDTDRVVVFEDTDRIRHSLDEDTVLSLLSQRYVERRSARDTVSCLHGVVRKPVTPLRLTKTGAALLHRWSALHPLT